MRNLKIAAAIAASLGAAAAHAVAPTLAQCQGATNQVYVAGSSAIQSAFWTGLNTDVFAGNGALSQVQHAERAHGGGLPAEAIETESIETERKPNHTPTA